MFVQKNTRLLGYTHIITWYMTYEYIWYMIHDIWHKRIYHITILLSKYVSSPVQTSLFVVEPTLEFLEHLRFTQKWFLGSCLFMLFEPGLGNSPGYDTTDTQPDAAEPWIEKMGCQFWNTTSRFDGNDSEKIYTLHTHIYIYIHMYTLMFYEEL